MNHSLEDVRAAAQMGRVFLKKTRAKDHLVEVLGSQRAAIEFAEQCLCELVEGDFAESITQNFNLICDVYALRRIEIGWYVKLYLDVDLNDFEENVVVMSFHPLERRLKTQGGWVEP